MARNIEVKARSRDLEATARIAALAGATDHGVMTQVDTYFRVASGRLKLREIEGPDGTRAELIAYHRTDAAEVRMSAYEVSSVGNPEALCSTLALDHGVLVRVRKRRRLFIWKNVRIHLDLVDGLGEFIELEGVVGPEAHEAESRRQVLDLLRVLGVSDQDFESRSYSDLLLNAAERPPVGLSLGALSPGAWTAPTGRPGPTQLPR